MRPKKRPADCLSTPEPTPDNIEADHELFLQAFESKDNFKHFEERCVFVLQCDVCHRQSGIAEVAS